jgi:hypothetical protein
MTKLVTVVIACAVMASPAAAGEKSVHDGKEVVDAAGNALVNTYSNIGDFLAKQDLDSLFERIETAAPTLGKIAKGAFRRARRSVSIGPTLGLAGGGAPYDGRGEGMLSFGLGFEKFKVPILPSFSNLKELVKERAKAKLKEQVIARFKGQEPAPLDLEAMAKEAWLEAIEEIMGIKDLRAKRMEKPQFSFAIEVNRYFESEAWAPRLRVGVGVWKLTLAVTTALATTDPKLSVYTGADVSMHVMMSKNPRSSVLDVFVRADFEIRNRIGAGDMGNTDTYLLGVRYLLDII